MRFVWAVVAFFVAAILIGAGIAQRTVFLGPTTEQAAIADDVTTPYVLIDGAVLGRLPGSQTLVAKQEGDIFAAYGRTADVTAWLADADYTSVTLDEDGEIVSDTVLAAQAAPEVSESDQAAVTALGDADLPSPQSGTPLGSDLWLDEFTDTDSLITQLALPENMSVLLATDGTAAAPGEITLSWPIDNSTPLAGPLVVLGGIALAVGVLFYILGIRHMRRSRGPRRRGTPTTEAIATVSDDVTLDEESAAKGVISSGRKRGGRARRIAVAVPVLAGSLALMTGCTADAWPKFDAASPSPTPSQSVVAPEDQQSPVVTEAQAERIIDRVAAAVAAADEAKDATLAQGRLGGAALAERLTNYTLRGALEDEEALTPVPSSPYRIILPQAIDGWPRTIMAVWNDEADTTNPPRIMMLTQENAWSAYKLQYIGQMEASAEIPALPPTDIGANLVRLDSSLLMIAPDQLAAAYADVIDLGGDSEYAGLFNTDDDAFLAKVVEGRLSRLDAFNETGQETGTLTFSSAAGDETPIALQTLHSGAIVAVTIDEFDEVRATDADAVIKVTDNKRVATLSGVEQSAVGFKTTYVDQLFFYVPGQGTDEKIELIGFTSNILNAEELK